MQEELTWEEVRCLIKEWEEFPPTWLILSVIKAGLFGGSGAGRETSGEDVLDAITKGGIKLK